LKNRLKTGGISTEKENAIKIVVFLCILIIIFSASFFVGWAESEIKQEPENINIVFSSSTEELAEENGMEIIEGQPPNSSRLEELKGNSSLIKFAAAGNLPVYCRFIYDNRGNMLTAIVEYKLPTEKAIYKWEEKSGLLTGFASYDLKSISKVEPAEYQFCYRKNITKSRINYLFTEFFVALMLLLATVEYGGRVCQDTKS